MLRIAALLAALGTVSPWSAVHPKVTADVLSGRPLVTVVVVPLCSNAQLDCGSASAGRPADLAHNIYWGAVFGARRYFERKTSGFARVEAQRVSDTMLEQATFRRTVPGQPWGTAAPVEQLVVLQAFHGDHIDAAVDHFWRTATAGGTVVFLDGARRREEAIHVVGYAGHNRLMDGTSLPTAPAAGAGAPLPSFVLACFSERYFGAALRSAGSSLLLSTRTFMAPEGYVIHAVADALGQNVPGASLRSSAVNAYMHWQRIGRGEAGWVFVGPG
jgi:hypothetical protein